MTGSLVSTKGYTKMTNHSKRNLDGQRSCSYRLVLALKVCRSFFYRGWITLIIKAMYSTSIHHELTPSMPNSHANEKELQYAAINIQELVGPIRWKDEII